MTKLCAVRGYTRQSPKRHSVWNSKPTRQLRLVSDEPTICEELECELEQALKESLAKDPGFALNGGLAL